MFDVPRYVIPAKGITDASEPKVIPYVQAVQTKAPWNARVVVRATLAEPGSFKVAARFVLA